MDSAEIYDPELQSFSPAGAMTVARAGHVAIRLPDNNQVLLAGGRDANGEPLASAEIYTPWTGTFEPATPMAAARAVARIEAGKRGVVIVTSEGGAEAFHFPTVTAVRSDKNNETVDIDGEGWQPGEIVRLALRDRQVTAAADAGGNFQRQISEGTSRSSAPSYVTARGHVWPLTTVRIKDFTSVTFDSIDQCAYYFPSAPLQCPYPHQLLFTIMVTGDSPVTPAGTVELLSNSTDILQTQTLFDGEATFTIPPPPPGICSLTFMYTGNDVYASSTSAPVYCSIVANPDVVTLAKAASSVIGILPGSGSVPSDIYYYGQPLTLTATLSPASTGFNSLETPPTGTVQFTYQNAALGENGNLGSAPLQGSVFLPDGSAGTAAVSPVLLVPLDPINLIATYSGDGNFAKATSAPVALQVSPAGSGVEVSASPSQAVYGQPVTVQFTVAATYPSVAIPQGNSSLYLNGAVVSNQTLDASGGGAKAFNLLPGGANNISLVYAGNGNVTGNTGSATVTVTPATPSIAVTSSMNPSVVGQTVTLTFNVTTTIPVPMPPLIGQPLWVVPAGAVGYDYRQPGGSVIVVVSAPLGCCGILRVPFTPTTAGTYTIEATYVDTVDGNFTSVSGFFTQTVHSPCDVNGDGVFTITDVQGIINEALGAAKAADDLNADGRVTVTDAQIVINAVLSLACTPSN